MLVFTKSHAERDVGARVPVFHAAVTETVGNAVPNKVRTDAAVIAWAHRYEFEALARGSGASSTARRIRQASAARGRDEHLSDPD